MTRMTRVTRMTITRITLKADVSVLKSYAVTIEFPAFQMTIQDDLYAKMAEAQGQKSGSNRALTCMFCFPNKSVMWHSLENCFL